VARAAAAADIPLWINRDLMLALELGAVGVHLGPEDQQAIDAVRRNG
jgi:thiamine monophosphate synthase